MGLLMCATKRRVLAGAALRNVSWDGASHQDQQSLSFVQGTIDSNSPNDRAGPYRGFHPALAGPPLKPASWMITITESLCLRCYRRHRVSHDTEIAINAINVGLSLLILSLLLVLVRQTARQGLNVVGARLFLRKKEALRGLLLILAGIVVFIASNVLELYGDVFHIDWNVNEAVETIALAPMITGLAWFQQILRLPSRAGRLNTIQVEEAPPE